MRSSAAEWLPQDEVLGDLAPHAQCSECYSNMVGTMRRARRAKRAHARHRGTSTTDPLPEGQGQPVRSSTCASASLCGQAPTCASSMPSSALPATVVDALVSTIDIALTVLEAAGIPVPSDFDGESFLAR